MKSHYSLRTKFYLLKGPLLVLLCSLTLGIVHAMFELHRQVTRVEQGTSSVVSSGHLAQICNRYETDYWDVLQTGSAAKKKQAEDNRTKLLSLLEQFRQESKANSDRPLTTRLERLKSDYEQIDEMIALTARQRVDAEIGGVRENTVHNVGHLLTEVIAPQARRFAVDYEAQLERDVASIEATSGAIFWNTSPIRHAAEWVAIESTDVILAQRATRRLTAEVAASSHYLALLDGSHASLEREQEMWARHAQTLQAFEDLQDGSDIDATDASGKEMVAAIRRRYEIVSSLNQQLRMASSGHNSRQAAELKGQLESEVNSVNATLDEYSDLQDAQMQSRIHLLRSSLKAAEWIVASICGAFLLLGGGITLLLVRTIIVPISNLTEATGHLAKGDLAFEVPENSRDELGKLAAGFNSMARSIRQRTAELEVEVGERKQAEAAMRVAKEAAEVASAAKSEFLANMSHEIRTPLNGVVGMTELALGTEMTSEQREYLNTIKLSGDSLLAVINDVLDFSKIEAGKAELETTDFNLSDCVEETVRTFALQADLKKLELLCEIRPDVPEFVSGDKGRLRQILLNLLGNAIKFTRQGEVCLQVDRDDGTAEPMLRFTVSDTGIGIPSEKLTDIFEPFTQADNSTTRNYGGTGLGLTISARLVAMMGGRVWVESVEDRGTQFHFTAQLQTAAEQPELDGTGSSEMLRGLKVLIVDDNSTNRRILEGTLKGWQVHSNAVAGGVEALYELTRAQLAGEPYQLVLTDMHMPAMDGFGLVEEIRHQALLSTVPIMMLTSGHQRCDAQRCRKLGINSCLFKPIRRRELLSAMLDALVQTLSERSFIRPELSKSLSGIRILVVEDNRVNQAVAVCNLERMGHTTVIANNGKEALAFVQTERFDLVFMDIQMPEMDGLTATKLIREGEKESGGHVPIIAMTAHARKGDEETCLEAGMDGYVTKPIRPGELQDAIARLMLTTSKMDLDPVVAPLANDGKASQSLSCDPAAAMDISRALELAGGDEKLLEHLCGIFLEETPKLLMEIRESISQRNPSRLERAAHTLKGSASVFCHVHATSAALALENMGRGSNFDGVEPAYSRLVGAISELEKSMPKKLALR